MPAVVSPALMMVDLMMPVMDGWTLIETRRAEGLAPGVPLVIVSADRNVADKC